MTVAAGRDLPRRAGLPAKMREEKLDDLESDLQRIPGVKQARVIGMGSPSEIHIVATRERPAKQLVRDVQSLASAGFGISIDHRIVSVVQLGEDEEPAAEVRLDEQPAPEIYRPVLDRVVFASKGHSGWVKVGLRWPDGAVTQGAASAGATREARARGAGMAVVQALEPALNKIGAGLDVDHVMVQRIGHESSVLVHAVYHDKGASTPLVGSALVYDDVASAAVRAVLQAVNRKLA
jgi:hypothetical protein